MDAQQLAGRRAARRQLGLDLFTETDEDDAYAGVGALELDCGRHRDMGAVIAPHAVNGDGDVQSSLPLATFFPR